MCISKEYMEGLNRILDSLNKEETMETEKTTGQFKLRACPFCGETEDLKVQYGRIFCQFCGAQGPNMPNDKLAVAFWNNAVHWKIDYKTNND